MANGVTAAALLPIDSEPMPTTDSSPPTTEAEIIIGAAVRECVFALYRAMADYQQDGALAPATREAGGTRMARVSTLMLDHELGDSDFIALAHRAGRRELRRYLNAELFRKHGADEVDKVLDAVIDHVFEIVSLAVRDERAIRAALAN
jgi:hypothetical protein